MLDSKNIKTLKLNKSLNHKNLKSFKVIKTINNITYELKLPNKINIYPVFHLWLLHLDNSDPLLRQVHLPPPSVQTDDKGSENFVDKVIDSRIDRRRLDLMTGKKGCLMYKFK